MHRIMASQWGHGRPDLNVTTAFVYVLGVHYIIDGNVSGVSIGVLIAFHSVYQPFLGTDQYRPQAFIIAWSQRFLI